MKNTEHLSWLEKLGLYHDPESSCTPDISQVHQTALQEHENYQNIKSSHDEIISEHTQNLSDDILNTLTMCQQHLQQANEQPYATLKTKMTHMHNNFLELLRLHRKQVNHLSSEYQKDIETIIHCYQSEKVQFKQDYLKQSKDLNAMAKQFQQIDSAYQAEQQQRMNLTKILHQAEEQIINLKTSLAAEQKLRLHAETIHQDLIDQMSLAQLEQRHHKRNSS